MSAQVLADVPRYGTANPETAARLKPLAVENDEIVYLPPIIVDAEKPVKLSEPALLTKRAFAAGILKQYDYSAFSFYQHRETVRLENRMSLLKYADNLLLVGDVAGSRAIVRESDRLFLRPHDPETESIDLFLNPRAR